MNSVQSFFLGFFTALLVVWVKRKVRDKKDEIDVPPREDDDQE